MEEKEIKAKVKPELHKRVQEHFESRGYKGRQIKQKDVYYDSPELLLTNLLRGLRMRFHDDKPNSLEFKSLFKRQNPLAAQPFFVEEIVLPLPLESESLSQLTEVLARFGFTASSLDWISSDKEQKISALLSRFGLQELLTLAKTRTTYEENGVQYMLDYLEGIGHFIEIEIGNSDKGPQEALEELLQTDGYEVVRKGYNEMLLSLHPGFIATETKDNLFKVNPTWNILDTERAYILPLISAPTAS